MTGRPMILVRATKTAGWRVVYRADSGHEYVLEKQMSPTEAQEYADAAQTVYQVPVEVEQ